MLGSGVKVWKFLLHPWSHWVLTMAWRGGQGRYDDSVLQRKQLRSRGMKQLAQSHTANLWRGQGWTQDLLLPGLLLFALFHTVQKVRQASLVSAVNALVFRSAGSEWGHLEHSRIHLGLERWVGFGEAWVRQGEKICRAGEIAWPEV